MPIFKYKAVDTGKNIIKGLIEADSESSANNILVDKGLEIIYLKREFEVYKESKLLMSLNRIKHKDLVVFSRQFSIMVSANVSLVDSLRILVDQTESFKLKMVISEIADEVDGGSKLSEALAKRPHIFSEFYVNIIKSGETSGKLDEVLNYLADEMEKDYDMMSKIRGAMIYPVFVFSVLLIVGFLMMAFVVPKLVSIFSEAKTTLPLATRILISTSSFLASYWWAIIIFVIIIIFSFRLYLKTEKGRNFIDIIKLKLPIFGKLFQKIYLVRFSRSMDALVASGVPIVNSLGITSKLVGNKVYYNLISETIREVEGGNSISSVFINSKEVPRMVSEMIIIGEKTGKLDIVLKKLANFYTREIDNTTANLTTLMEPIIIVTIGIAVAILVAAIILPMYNLSLAY